MRKFVPVRFLAVVAVAGAGSMAAVSLAGSASAAPRTVVTCAHVNAPAPKSGASTVTAALSGCTVPSATGGTGKLVANIAGGTAVITWNKTGTTSMTFTEAAAAKPDEKETSACPAHTTEIVASGKVTAGTGAAGKAIAVGSPVSAEVCVTAKSVTTNEPGNKLSI